MDYTISKLAKLAGVSTRTLRYYDQIGLLKPNNMNASGYRVYGESEVDLLQQILFFKELGMPLEQIKITLNDQHYDPIKVLEIHSKRLMNQRNHIDQLIASITMTINAKKEGIPMANDLKFKALKAKQIEENELQYGKEIRHKYGTNIIEESNNRYAKMDQQTYDKAQALSMKIFEHLSIAMDKNDLSCEDAFQAVQLHKEWLMIYWPEYTIDAHRGIGDMYLSDDRFKSFYDHERIGTAQFLRDAIYLHTTV